MLIGICQPIAALRK